MRIPHIDKMPPKSVAFSFDSNYSHFVTYKMNIYDDSVPVLYMCDNLVPMFHMCENLVPVLNMCEFWYQFFICDALLPIFHMLVLCTAYSSHELGLGNDSSQLWKFVTNYSHRTCTSSSHVKNHKNAKFDHKLTVHKFHTWKVTYFTICANSSHGLNTKCDICGSTQHLIA